MNALEAEFLEEYKRLEGFCNDIFSGQNGVSEYIDEMKANETAYRALVPSWSTDLRMLKHLRFLRNKIAHESGNSGCTAADLKSAKEFFARLVNEEDPITVARNLRKKDEKPKRKKKAAFDTNNAGTGEEAELKALTGNFGARNIEEEVEETGTYHRRSYAYEKKENGEPPKSGCLLAILIFVLAGGIALIVLALLGII